MSFPNKFSYEASRIIDNIKISVEESAEFVSNISFEDAWLNAYHLAREKAEKTLEETIRKMDKEDLCVVKLKGNQGPRGYPGPSYKNLSLYYTFNNSEDIKNFTLEIPKSPTDPHYYSIINNVPNPYAIKPLSNLVSSKQTSNLNKSFNNVRDTTSDNGTNNDVVALAIDTTNNLIYVGGNFTYVNGTTTSANYIASWNYSTSEWSSLTSTIDNITYNGVNNYVNTLYFDTNSSLLYLGGIFTNIGDSGSPTLNNVAIWDGTTMYALTDATYGIGVNNTGLGSQSGVQCIKMDSLYNIYLGGNFKYAGDGTSLQVNNITYWVPDTSGSTGSGSFYALTDNSGNDYGTGVNTIPECITLDTNSDSPGNIYIGGQFTYTGTDSSTGLQVNNITYWVPDTSGSTGQGSFYALTDSTYGTGVSGFVFSIIVDSSYNIYIGGQFKYAGNDTTSLQVNNITYWVPDTSGSTGQGSFYALTDNSGNDYGTGFASAGSQVTCVTLDTSSGYVYIGGDFTYTGTKSSTGLVVNNIAYWAPDTTGSTGEGSFYALTNSTYGTGVNSFVNTILYDSSTISFIGGDFTYTGTNSSSGLSVNYIAQVSSTSYSIQLTNKSINKNVNKSTYPICPSSITLGNQYTTNLIRYDDKCFELVSIIQGTPIPTKSKK